MPLATDGPSRILVTGASRGIGLETVKAALAAGHFVRALARRATSIPIDDPNLEKAEGDACNRSHITTALDGFETVIQTLGVTLEPQTVLFGTTLFSTATRALVDAMQVKKVNRLIVVTGLGAGDSRGYGGLLHNAVLFPLVMKRIYDDKDVQEQIVKSSGLTWTLVRPGILTDGPATGRFHILTEPKDWRLGTISRADVARFLIDEASHSRYAGRAPVLIT